MKKCNVEGSLIMQKNPWYVIRCLIINAMHIFCPSSVSLFSPEEIEEGRNVNVWRRRSGVAAWCRHRRLLSEARGALSWTDCTAQPYRSTQPVSPSAQLCWVPGCHRWFFHVSALVPRWRSGTSQRLSAPLVVVAAPKPASNQTDAVHSSTNLTELPSLPRKTTS